MPSEAFTVEPLWVSSREHLAEFGGLLDETPWFKRMMGRVQVPDGFPCVEFQSRYVPIVYFSSGILELRNSTVHYTAQKKLARTGAVYHDLDESLTFTFDVNEMVRISRYRGEERFIKYYSIEWIELEVQGRETPLLICVGGRGPGMRKIRNDTDQLFNMLKRLRAAT